MGPGFRSHASAIHKSVTGVGLDFNLLVAVTIHTDLAVLNIAVGNTVDRIRITGTGVAANAVRIVIRTTVVTQLLTAAAIIGISGI